MVRSTAWSLLAIAAIAAGDGEDPGGRLPIDVYLMAGQSNITGQGVLAKLPALAVHDPRAWLFHSPALRSSTPPLTWGPLRPASETPEKFGPELSFGTRMQQLTADRPVALIKHGLTATDLAFSWDPGKGPDDRARFGAQFEILVATVEAGLAGLRDRGFEPTIRGMIWQQGEVDATEFHLAMNYLENFARFIPRVREQFRAPDMVFIYGFILPPPNAQPFREAIRTAQGAVDQESGSLWAVRNAFTVYTDDLPHFDPHPAPAPAAATAKARPPDYVHFGTLGTWELGRRMAEAMHRRGGLPR